MSRKMFTVFALLILNALVYLILQRDRAVAVSISAPVSINQPADDIQSNLSTPQLIEADLQRGIIDHDTAALYLAYALRNQAELPAKYHSPVPWDGTLPLLRLQGSVGRMAAGQAQREAERILAGVCGSSSGGLPNQVDTTNFHVEYNTIGAGLTITDYTSSLETSWATEISAFGWAAPPVLGSNPPPGNRYHVRIDSLGGSLYGYVTNAGDHAGLVGNNPNTAWDDGDAYATCMVINEDFTGFSGSPQQALDATTAHEFNHSIQFGYGAITGANAPDDSFVEGGATWMEDEVFDSANDNYNYLWPDFAMSMGEYTNSPYPYWITFRSLTERYGTGSAGGGEQVMQDFWEETSQSTSSNMLTALDTALVNQGTNLADAYHAYAIAVKFNHSCGGNYVYPYCFEEGADYVAAAGSTSVHGTIANIGDSYAGTPGIADNYALNWTSLPDGTTSYNIELENTSAGGQLRGSVVCDTGSELIINPLPNVVSAGGTANLSAFDPTGCSSIAAVLTNQSQTSDNPTTSTERSYLLSTSTVTLTILSPLQINPAYAGPFNTPQKFIVHVTKPATGLTVSDFDVMVGGLVANVITVYEGTNEYVLEVLPPPQSANGLYDLDVSATVSSTVFSDSEAQAVLHDDSNNVDVALVIDRSGSMGDGFYGPSIYYMEPAREAAKLFVELMGDNDQVSVVSFDDMVEVPYPLTIAGPSPRTAAIHAIDSLYARGGTSIGGGLEEGQNQLTSSGVFTHPWAIVLLSDGQENTLPMVADVLPGIVTTKTEVHTIALGDFSDQALMLDIADQTGGTYNLVPAADPDQLQGIYNTIATAVSGQQTLLALTGSVLAGATDQKNVVVDSTIGEATFSISWAGSTGSIDLTLEDPGGNAINPTVAASNPDIIYISGSTYAYYRIKSPTLVSGVWKMMITGGTIPFAMHDMATSTSAESYTALVTGQVTGVATTLNLYIDRATYNTGEPIKVSVTLSDDQPITGTEIVAIVGPIITAGSPSQAQLASDANPILILYDDGLHGDGPANDGVYANTLDGSNTANAGVYDFQVFTTGTSNNSEEFSRLVRHSVNVGLDANSFSSNLAEYTHTIYLPVALKP